VVINVPDASSQIISGYCVLNAWEMDLSGIVSWRCFFIAGKAFKVTNGTMD
jgi:hypothetical protein